MGHIHSKNLHDGAVLEGIGFHDGLQIDNSYYRNRLNLHFADSGHYERGAFGQKCLIASATAIRCFTTPPGFPSLVPRHSPIKICPFA